MRGQVFDHDRENELVRRLLKVSALVVVALSSVLLAATWGGPLFSGALLLLVSNGATAVVHDLSSSYQPLHQGHVDLATGLYVREDEDLVLGETPPFVWRRTYLVGDHVSRQFGVGATHNGEWYLIGDPARFQWAELILADGGRIRFDRLTPGASFMNAVFGHTSTPTGFYGSSLGWVGLGWALRLRDGSVVRFLQCGPGSRPCSLDEIRDPDGHTTSFGRDRTGLLRRVDTHRQHLRFEYDDHQRIVRALDDSQHIVEYEYDSEGRLVRATSKDAVRSYTYDSAHRLVTVREPGRVVVNRYDGTNRLVHQTVQRPPAPDYTEAFAYIVNGDSVVETTVTENDGSRTRYRFDEQHRMMVKLYDRPGRPPVTVSFDRAHGGLVRSLTVRCTKSGRPVTDTVPVGSGDEERVASEMMRDTCD